MGYDLLNRASAAQRAVHGDWFTHPENYHRLSYPDIHALRVALLHLGMAYDVAEFGYQAPDSWTGIPGRPPLVLPEPTDYGLTAQTDPCGFTVWDGERVAEYRAARTRVLALHVPTDQPGVPIHKLSGHDGWIVTRDECVQALAAYRHHRARGHPHPPAFGDGFITFLTACADRDGFLVT